MFFIYVFSIWAMVITHIFFRTQGLFVIGGKARLILGLGFYLLGFAYLPARMLIRAEPSSRIGVFLAYGAVLFIGLVAILWTLLVFLEAAAVLVWIVNRLRVKNAPVRTGRIMASSWWGAGVILALAGIVSAHATPSITRLKIHVPGAEPGRFAVISDTHLGVISSMDQWRRTLKAVQELEPTALLIPGDLIDDRSYRAEKQVAMIREFFPDKPVYVSIGNHEKYSGLDFFASLCLRFRFRLLRQEAVPLLPGLTIAGIDDHRGQRAQDAVEKALSGTPGALLFLAHRPEVAHFLSDRPGTFMLSGHTHGGQVIPMVFLVALGNGGFRSGYYKVGRAHLYVSNGAGVWGPPMRLLAPSEIVLLEVSPGPEFEVTS
jgi:predicted MPP superfamily phosphohydrolase